MHSHWRHIRRLASLFTVSKNDYFVFVVLTFLEILSMLRKPVPEGIPAMLVERQ